MSHDYFLLLLISALLQPLPAAAAERTPVTSVKPLLVTAIDQGQAQGVLIGNSADYMRQRFNSSAPIEIDVKVVRALPQAGCKRLQVTTRQSGVTDTPNASPQPKALTYEVSYCRDGRFPETQ